MTLKKVASDCMDRLLAAGLKHKTWTAAENREWSRAIEALKRLSGEK